MFIARTQNTPIARYTYTIARACKYALFKLREKCFFFRLRQQFMIIIVVVVVGVMALLL